MLHAIALSFAVNFAAEMGDKSQLVTMTYAMRHRWWVVLGGVGIAATLLRGVAVGVGHFLSLKLPAKPIAVVAGIIFIGFALWAWRQNADETAEDDDAPPAKEPRSVLASVFTSYVLAELGDKTMFATIALASGHYWPGVWIGSTAGIVTADAMAIAIGMIMHRRLPERFLHVSASLLFFACGIWLLFASALRWHATAIAVIAVMVTVVVMIEALRAVRERTTERLDTTEPDQH